MSQYDRIQIEQYALDVLSSLGWQILHGPDVGPDGVAVERELRQVVLAWASIWCFGSAQSAHSRISLEGGNAAVGAD
ncbi:hypothetical protein [Candidatus Minimicrobia naudis]